MSHVPVLLDEVIEAMSPRAGEHYVDGTFGAGGYTKALLGAAACRVTGIDRDPNVLPDAQALMAASDGRFDFVQAPFSQMGTAMAESGIGAVDGVVLDIGVSSMQIDQAERGFSFAKPGPLDMRMSQSGPTAADAVNRLSEKELADIFYVYGEERKSRRVAKFIIEARKDAAIETTEALAEIVSRAIGGKHSKIHPATRVFQALRIFVNDELGELARALVAAERLLKPLGRLVVVTFHSLEDRMVKSFLRERSGLVSGGSRHTPQIEAGPAASFRLESRRAVAASEAEIERNPRARSAKLRVAVRTELPAWTDIPAMPGDVVALARLEAVS